MTPPRYTCADCGLPTENHSLICDACRPEYEDASPDQSTLCPFCGAYSTRSCDLIEDAGHCPWEELDDGDCA